MLTKIFQSLTQCVGVREQQVEGNQAVPVQQSTNHSAEGPGRSARRPPGSHPLQRAYIDSHTQRSSRAPATALPSLDYPSNSFTQPPGDGSEGDQLCEALHQVTLDESATHAYAPDVRDPAMRLQLRAGQTAGENEREGAPLDLVKTPSEIITTRKHWHEQPGSSSKEMETATKTMTNHLRHWVNVCAQDAVDVIGPPPSDCVIFALGSFGRAEITAASDLDVSAFILPGEPALRDGAEQWLSSFVVSMDQKWDKKREGIQGDALEFDWMKTDALLPGDIEKTLAPLEFGAIKQMWDMFSDATVLYESRQGAGAGILSRYKRDAATLSLKLSVALDSWNENVSPVRTQREFSVKEGIVRPLTLCAEAGYEFAKQGDDEHRDMRETGTLERLRYLCNRGAINADTFDVAQSVLLHALKWEEEAGCENGEHGADLKTARQNSKKFVTLIEQSKRLITEFEKMAAAFDSNTARTERAPATVIHSLAGNGNSPSIQTFQQPVG